MLRLTAAVVLSARASSAAQSDCGTSQIRLALTATKLGDEMLVAWTTAANATPANYAAVVKYGPTPTTMTMETEVADTRSYTLCDLPSPYLHKATLTGLKAGAVYYYTIVEPRCTTPDALQFNAPHVVGSSPSVYPFVVVAYGDMGITNSGPTAEFLAARIASSNAPNVITHAGDIS